MHCLRHLKNISVYNIVQRQLIRYTEPNGYKILSGNIFRTLHVTTCACEQNPIAKPLRSIKQKSKHNNQQYFVDIKQVR